MGVALPTLRLWLNGRLSGRLSGAPWVPWIPVSQPIGAEGGQAHGCAPGPRGARVLELNRGEAQGGGDGMRGWGAWSHGLPGPERAAHTPTQENEASCSLDRAGGPGPILHEGTVWLCQETGLGLLVPRVGSSPSAARPRQLPTRPRRSCRQR